MASRVRHVVGCMTGTSIDALDTALMRIEGEGLAMRATFVRAVTRPLGDLAPRLRAVAEQAPTTAGDIARLSPEFSLLHVEAIRDLLASQRADLVAVHGQTVFHAPPTSWQMLTPAVIAHALKSPVVFDMRAADLAAGGQGAPITPLADWIMFRHETEGRAVVNLGGFCNATLLGAEVPLADYRDILDKDLLGKIPRGIHAIRGLDLCMCNHLLDTIARRVMGMPYDDGGKTALAAEVDNDALDDILGILTTQTDAKRSLGTGDDDAMSWIGRHRTGLTGGTLAATACEAIGQIIAKHAQSGRLLLAGGGVKNAALVNAIASCCSCRVESTDKQGIPAEYREAAAMAVLGALCQDRVPITLSAVTGVKQPPVAGCWVLP